MIFWECSLTIFFLWWGLLWMIEHIHNRVSRMHSLHTNKFACIRTHPAQLLTRSFWREYDTDRLETRQTGQQKWELWYLSSLMTYVWWHRLSISPRFKNWHLYNIVVALEGTTDIMTRQLGLRWLDCYFGAIGIQLWPQWLEVNLYFIGLYICIWPGSIGLVVTWRPRVLSKNSWMCIYNQYWGLNFLNQRNPHAELALWLWYLWTFIIAHLYRLWNLFFFKRKSVQEYFFSKSSNMCF